MKIRRALSITTLAVAVALSGTACGGSSPVSGPGSSSSEAGSGRPQIVVTFPVLASVARAVIGDAGEVTVLIPNGTDPHQWNPSAKDIQAVLAANLVIANGLGLESKLHDPIQEAKAKGVDVFLASDHVTVRKAEGNHAEESHAEESHAEGEAEAADHDHSAGDPHLWLDPVSTKQWVQSLVPVLKAAGIDATANAAKVEADLDTLDQELSAVLESVPAARRKLVTGHQSLGYLADRYHYEMIGAVVPSLTSQGEANASDIARLNKQIKASGVPAIFTELGTPKATVEAIGKDTGSKVVELSTHTLPADGSYRTFMLDITNKIAGALR